jgi:Bacterial regulatory proteins, gntR family
VVAARGNFFVGKYALCAKCKMRPCHCTELSSDTSPAPAPSPIRAIGAPAPGNAIPYAVWDTIIPAYHLSVSEGAVLAYLCRVTIGYGKHEGDYISLRRIADALNMDRATARRALVTLAAHHLLIITGRRQLASQGRAKNHIRVTLGAT